MNRLWHKITKASLHILLALCCCTACSPDVPGLIRVSFAQKEAKSISASSDFLSNFSDQTKTVLYYKATRVGDAESSEYQLYDREFYLQQGKYRFDAIVFLLDKVSTFSGLKNEEVFASSLTDSQVSSFLTQSGCISAYNDEIYVNLNTTVIPLYLGEYSKTANGTVLMNFSSKVNSGYIAPVTPTGSGSNKETRDVVSENTLQRIDVAFYVVDSDTHVPDTSEMSSVATTFDIGLDTSKFTSPKGSTLETKINPSVSAAFAPGQYVAVIRVYNVPYTQTTTYTYSSKSWKVSNTGSLVQGTESLYWTETVGFTVYPGAQTIISGKAASTVQYKGNVISVTSDDSVDGEKIQDIQSSTVTGNNTYVIYPNNGSDTTYTLNNTDTDDNDNRIEIQDGVTDFMVDVNGTDVRTDVSASEEKTTIFSLREDLTLDLVNSNPGSTSIIGGTPNYTTSGSSTTDKYEEVYATIEMNGGTLNVSGSSVDSGVGNTPEITITGPSRNAGFSGREGAVNLSGSGGSINLDGNVSIGLYNDNLDKHDVFADQTVKGITCFFYDGDTTKKDTTVTGDSKEININLTNGASIYTAGDANESPAGIYLYGGDSNGNSLFTASDSISINLDKANVVTAVNRLQVDTDSSSGEDGFGYGIRLEKMGAAPISLTIKDSYIVDNWGDVISFKDCAGDITITIDNSKIGGAGNDYYPFWFENCTGNITIVVKNRSEIKSAGCFDFAKYVDCNTRAFVFKDCTGTKSVSVTSDCEFWIRSEKLGNRPVSNNTTYSHIYNSTKSGLIVDGRTITSSTTDVNGNWTTEAVAASGNINSIVPTTWNKTVTT